MSEYSSLKATINANVKTNNNQEITGSVMNSVLNAMVNTLGAGYQFIGVATPTNPGTAQTPDYKCFYLATTPGTYTNLGGLVVADGEVALLKWDTSWTKEVTGAATASLVSQLEQKIYDFTIPNYVLGKYPMKAGHKYFFKNIGTAGDGSVYYHVTEDVPSVKIGDIPLGGTLEFTATEDSQFVSKSNIPGFNIVVYEDGSTYQKLQTNESREMPFIISACSYNLGDFSGDGLVTPSDPGSLEYRKMIGSIGANLIGTQEDVLYYGGESGMESGESVRDAIFGMYKNYYRRGQYQFNFKGFASDYPISDVYPVSYTDDVYNHPLFLRGILNGDILVVSLHFDWQDITRRRKQITQLISYCQSYDKVILMGDTNPSNLINGEPVDPAIPEIHAEDWAYFANAGYQMANGGLFGDLGTMFGDWQYAGQLFPYDNIFVKGGYVRDVKVVSAEWMNDHKPIVATIVF